MPQNVTHKQPELTPEMEPFDKLLALIASAQHFEAGFVSIVGRDDAGNVISVGVVAEGAVAERLVRWLERREKDDQRRHKKKGF